jgi:hypothetical protein
MHYVNLIQAGDDVGSDDSVDSVYVPDDGEQDDYVSSHRHETTTPKV